MPVLKDLEARLDPSRFLRLGRGTLANIDCITKVQVMLGGTHVAILNTGQQLRIESPAIEEHPRGTISSALITRSAIGV